jgi:hypothetical protein
MAGCWPRLVDIAVLKPQIIRHRREATCPDKRLDPMTLRRSENVSSSFNIDVRDLISIHFSVAAREQWHCSSHMNDYCRFDLNKCKVYFGTNGDVTKLIRNTRPFLFGDVEVENGYDPTWMLFFECVHDSTTYETVASCDENGLCHVTAMLQIQGFELN